MYKLKITTPDNASYILFIPPFITFFQLHAALEILLLPAQGAYYGFQLMTDHCSIEAPDAKAHQIFAVFARNLVICYRNPYPGGPSCMLELLDKEATEESLYPIVQGTKADEAYHGYLRKYCTFSEKWVYRNREFFIEIGGERDFAEARGSHVSPSSESSVQGLYYIKKIQDKTKFLKFFMYTNSDHRFRITGSACSQAKLLEEEWTKDRLQMFCRGLGLTIKANWRKQRLAESCCDYLRENIWFLMVCLPKGTLELYLRLCKVKKGQWYQMHPELDMYSLYLLLYWGIADLALEPGMRTPVLELTEDLKEKFMESFQSTVKYSRNSPAAVYLAPEMKTGSWQRVVEGYKKLDNRVIGLLHYYGILSVSRLCGELKRCYGYLFTEQELKRYAVMRLEALDLVGAGTYTETGEYFVTCRGLLAEEAFEALESYPVETDWKPADRAALEKQEQQAGEWLGELGSFLGLLEDDNENEILDLLVELRAQVAGNASWGNYLLEIGFYLECLTEQEQVMLWFMLSRLYLKLPVAGLGGYSRVEYAKKHQIGNPYQILNHPGNNADWLEDTIYSMPFDVQWKLFDNCDCLIRDMDEQAERRMMKYAKKMLGQEQAEFLLMYCYMVSGNPKLIKLLQDWADEGDEEACKALETLMYLLEDPDEK